VSRAPSRGAPFAPPRPVDSSARSQQRKWLRRSRRFRGPWLVDSGDLPPETQFDLLIRVSAQVYNYLGQYERLSSILAGFAGVNRPQTGPAPSTVATE